ncbi:MAG: hypothetical protein KDD47_04920, partial [Acidobacteria bacterium]|nr:hypothetical protein [Acidobacteriota bacterium]
LEITWTYSRRHHREATLTELGRQQLAVLLGLIDHCLSSAGTGHTPADFPEADLDQAELDELLAELGESVHGEAHRG